ncbi:hypothetical protein C823_003112 [Eubacterium plexicaudatum ASF492]|uniref:DUF1002 domain-containing protein n=1 Tax=Eubacterium plexicaudatum ASF492 TaxID=1235802 RepID=N2AL18_9FIRM|nr:hypothetical protein C823_003112 [Eubacterium plexicaudatum ASF492]
MSIKWKKWTALLLAGLIGFSSYGSARAAGVDQGMVSDGADQDTQAVDTGERTQSEDAGQGIRPENTDQSIQPEDEAQIAQPGDANVTGTDDASAPEGERPVVNAEIGENPGVEADISENDQDIHADITTDDEQDDHVVITEEDKPYLALGANLNNEQKNTVLNLMGVDPANLDQYQVVTVTNEEEHRYLDAYLDASIIGTRALSSVVIVKRDKGDGIHISTKNISYCTIGMYKNALATAGLEDADVIIAGPFPLSGTAALIGAMKAYADMEEAEIDTQSLDAAMNEIVVTGELNESLGDDVRTEEFIAYVKQKVVEGGLQSKEKIQEVLADACDKFEITLSEGEKESITALMEKIGSLDIDLDSLIEQAGSIYDSLKEMESSGGFLSKIAAFFKDLLDAIVRFFENLF